MLSRSYYCIYYYHSKATPPPPTPITPDFNYFLLKETMTGENCANKSCDVII